MSLKFVFTKGTAMWKPVIVKERKTKGKKLTKKQTIFVIIKVLKSHADMWRL